MNKGSVAQLEMIILRDFPNEWYKWAVCIVFLLKEPSLMAGT